MLQNVEDASDELILFDDDQMVPYPFVTDAGAFKTSQGGGVDFPGVFRLFDFHVIFINLDTKPVRMR